MTLRPLILERLLDSKSCQDQEKVVSKSIQKSGRVSIRIFIDLGSILEAYGDYVPAIGIVHALPFLAHAFSSSFLAVLAPSWPLLGSI